MKISIVIVNYNVVHFLDQCLSSVYKALKEVAEAEIFVVDNNSVDNSIAMVRAKYPNVILIENKDNVGFAKANNQAIRQSSGEYILLLNPDTVVEETTFAKCITFMDEHKDCGGLGIKMIDGYGNLLKESKRGFPTPWVSFCKFSGLIKVFPHSKKYAGYYLGHLSYEQTNEVEVLAGAYMMLRRECLDKTGLLDEDYFMYGEDIDLSYRITKSGYKNYYLHDARIIHYKGESTKKGSLNYVYTFYNAMEIFAKKHLSSKQSKTFSFIITLSIWFKAAIASIVRIFNNTFQPILDFALSYLGFYLLERYWAATVWHDIDYYSPAYLLYVIPCYILVLLASVYIYGGYSKNTKATRIISGVFFGMITLLVFYSLLPASLRYSRALILIGSVMTLGIILVSRLLTRYITTGNANFSDIKAARYLIIGEKNESERVAQMLRNTQLRHEFIYCQSSTTQIQDIIRIYNISEVIFCAKSLPQTTIISLMSEMAKTNIHYSIAPETVDFIISSNSINTPIDLYTVTLNSINQEDNRRKKRLFDLSASLILLALSPILIFVIKSPLHYIRNCVLVLFSGKTLVGYATDSNINDLPPIKPCVLTTKDSINDLQTDDSTIHRLNLLYARNYSVERDFNIVIKGIKYLGRSC
ncbi:MAG: glycosyltransferase family 2 protein [Bacteroidales bacterium]|jgi:GT2 family glycosyltransferase|nr:glycosyltransferase family 2 protein [Bacteroidales bacterium]